MAETLVENCDNKGQLSIATLLSSCIAKDVNGDLFIRKVEYTDPGSPNAITCGTAGLTDWEQLEQLLRQCIVLDANGKPALRFGTL